MRSLFPIALALLAAPALAQQPPASRGALPPGTETTIPLLQPERIRDFEPDGDSAVFLQDMRFHWYHVDLNRPCRALRFVDAIAVRSRFSYALDRDDDVVAGGERCTVAKIVTSTAPKRDGDRKRHGKG